MISLNRSRFIAASIFPSMLLTRTLALLTALLLTLHFSAASAHPLGQNTFNRQAAITLGSKEIRVHYLLDLAEIPTVAAGEDADTDHDGDISDAEWQAYADRWVQTLPQGLMLTLDGQPLNLQLGAYHWAVKAGTAGFSTLRMQADLSTPVSVGAAAAKIEYRDQTRADRLGWKEVWIAADRGAKIVSSNVPDHDRSSQLTNFTLRDGGGPPDELAAHAEFSLASASNGTPGNTPIATSTPAVIDDARSSAKTTGTTSAPTHWSLAWSFFRLGMHHIATGWDHLMFLLGLILLCTNFRQLAKTITAFTLAHSVTLALAAEGLVRPPGAWVEALIAVTIAYVGIVALLWRERRHGAWLAFGFGLVHGFGFAGALAESLGASQSLRLIGLVTFNLGIETFQLMLVCLVVPALRLLQPFRGYVYVRNTLASAVFLAGSGWLLARTLGEGPLAMCCMIAVVLALIAMLWFSRSKNAQPSFVTEIPYRQHFGSTVNRADT